MYKFLLFIFSGLVAVGPLSAQCDISAEITDVSCDPFTGDVLFNLTVTGSEATFRFPEFGLEFPLPLDEEFFVPLGPSDSLRLIFESGEGNADCRDTLILFPPDDCPTISDDCSVVIELVGTTECGVADSLFAVATGTPPFTYQWNSGDTSAMIAALPDHSFYTVTITDADGCTNFAHLSLDNTAFFVHVEASGNPCQGDPPTLTATTDSGTAPFTYLWSTGDTTQIIPVTAQEEIYTVTVTDANGCSTTGLGFYHPGGFGEWIMITGPDNLGCEGEPVILSVADPTPGFEYVWVNGQDTLFGDSIIVSEAGFFSVSGSNPDNPECVSFGGFVVNDLDFDLEELAIISVSQVCDSSACLGVISSDAWSLLFHPVEITWSSPTGNDFTENSPFICIDEPGVYRATVIGPCDTFEIFTEIKDFEECVDLCGTLIMDENEDCLADETFPNWPSVPMLITNDSTNISYPLYPDHEGNFCITVPAGSYQMHTSMGSGMVLSMDCEETISGMSISAAGGNDVEVFMRPAGEEAADETTSLFSAGTTIDKQLIVYPNPSSGTIQLATNGLDLLPTDVLTFYDALGRETSRIDVSNLPTPWLPQGIRAGVYTLILTEQNGTLKARSRVVFR